MIKNEQTDQQLIKLNILGLLGVKKRAYHKSWHMERRLWNVRYLWTLLKNTFAQVMQRIFLKQDLYPNKADCLKEHEIITATEQVIVNAQYKNNQFFCKHQHNYIDAEIHF